jgi:hypothetical protein
MTTVTIEEELRAALDREHRHREYGYFGHMGMAAVVSRRVGRPDCRTCELIGRPLHTEHPGLNGTYPDVCLSWHEDDD